MSTPESPKHVPPVPRYGEYAPVPPAPVAEPASSAPQQPYGAPDYAQPAVQRPPRTADMIVSVVLLVLGFFGVAIAVINALTIDEQMQQAYEQYGVEGTYEAGPAGAIAAAVIIISHFVLYAVAVTVTIALVRKRRISFWMPLSAGVIAFLIMIITFMALAFADPALLEVLLEQSQG